MIRAAFPKVSEDVEKKETSWIRTAFDCAGANGAGPRRLAGVWAPLSVALHLAEFYGLQDVILPLATAMPDSDRVPRRSTRSSAASLDQAPTSPGKGKTPPAKRRRAESPKSPSSLGHNGSLPVLSSTSGLPTSSRRGAGRASASPGRVTRSSVSPGRQAPLRRSLRSPKPPTTVLEEDDEPVIEGPDPSQDIEAAKAIVAAVKKAAAEAAAPVSVDSMTVKRGREDGDTTLTLNLHRENPEELAIARPIASNRRIDMTPARKAAAWGALAFSIGLGAVYVMNLLLGYPVLIFTPHLQYIPSKFLVTEYRKDNIEMRSDSSLARIRAPLASLV